MYAATQVQQFFFGSHYNSRESMDKSAVNSEEKKIQLKFLKLCFGCNLTWKLTIWNKFLTLITKMSAY